MANMEEILSETQALLQRKQASFKGTKKALAGEDPASIPGAEHDGTPPAGSTEAQPEVADKTMGPKSTRTTEGAGDDSAVTRGHATEAGEGEVPPAKPLITGDADAKAAKCAAIGNDIMAEIRAWQKGAAPKPAAPAVKAAAPKAAAPKAPAAQVSKEADGVNMELTEKVLAKIASICLMYEDSAAAVTAALEKHAGETQAEEIVGFLNAQNEAYVKQAAEAAGYQDGMAMINQQLYAQGVAAGKQASVKAPVKAPVKATVKAAAPVVQPDAARIQSLIQLGEKLAQAGIGDIMGALPNEQGAPMGADPAAAMGADPAAAMGADPAAVAGADPAAAAMADPAAAGGAGEEFSVDDLAAALDVLVSQQQISPEDAQSIMQTVTEEATQTPMSGEGEPTGPATAEPAGESEPGEASEEGEGEGEESGEAAEKETPAQESKEGKARR